MPVETEPREPQLKCLHSQNTDARVYAQVQLTDARVYAQAQLTLMPLSVFEQQKLRATHWCGCPTEGHEENPLAS